MVQKKGYKMTEEHKQNIGKSNKGKCRSEETKKWLSEIKKNLPKEFYKRHSEMLKGRKLTEEHKRNIGKAIKGKHHSEETKIKMKLNHKGMLGKKLSEESKQKMINSLKGRIFPEKTKIKIRLARMNQVLPKKDTTIELKIQGFLKQLGIEFLTHQYMNRIIHGYQCDILIPSMNLVIECDGDYWHSYPIGRDIDHVRTSELLEKGFKVLRLWEIDIRKMELNEFKEKLSKQNRLNIIGGKK